MIFILVKRVAWQTLYYIVVNNYNCQALGPGPGLCLRHFNSFTSLRLKTLDQRADAIIQMHPPTHHP